MRSRAIHLLSLSFSLLPLLGLCVLMPLLDTEPWDRRQLLRAGWVDRH